MPMMVDQGGKGAAKFPEKTHTKHIPHVEGAGTIEHYPDREEDIRACQEAGIRMAKGRKQKAGYRN